MNDKLNHSNIEKNYINQHLANERTFLAWIRTAGATFGIGFIAISYHVGEDTGSEIFSKQISLYIGLISLFLGLLIIGFALYSYLDKRKGINEQTFKSSKWTLVIISLTMIVITVMYVLYLFIVY